MKSKESDHCVYLSSVSRLGTVASVLKLDSDIFFHYIHVLIQSIMNTLLIWEKSNITVIPGTSVTLAKHSLPYISFIHTEASEHFSSH